MLTLLIHSSFRYMGLGTKITTMGVSRLRWMIQLQARSSGFRANGQKVRCLSEPFMCPDGPCFAIDLVSAPGECDVEFQEGTGGSNSGMLGPKSLEWPGVSLQFADFW